MFPEGDSKSFYAGAAMLGDSIGNVAVEAAASIDLNYGNYLVMMYGALNVATDAIENTYFGWQMRFWRLVSRHA